MQTELRDRLKANATIAGLVGTRVDWGVRPQGKPLPAITLTLVSDVRDQTMAGLQVTQGPLIQVDCWALTYAETVTLREAVISLLATPATQASCKFLGAQNISSQDLPEDTDVGLVQRAIIRANIWHTT
jgi:hypothetical protein